MHASGAGSSKMELGYWDDVPDPGGAWEVRWLGWRFRTLGHELSRTVELLVAAQRRSFAKEHERTTDPVTTDTDLAPTPTPPVQRDGRDAATWLQAELERLQGTHRDDAEARSLAQVVLDRHAIEAERLGHAELRLRLEDAALRVIDPDGFREVSGRIEAERRQLEAQAIGREAQIRRALDVRGVPIVGICHRVKNAAGIWKKMHTKHLAFEQVHDLVALRIVVPTETDCYHALGVVHDLAAPIVGRFKDYIVQPKSNGYRGLHTSVRGPEGAVFEVQIRSVAMHRHADQGPAGYAAYKDATRIPVSPGRVAWWRRLLVRFGASPTLSKRDEHGLR